MLANDFTELDRLGDGAEGGAFTGIERATGRRVVLKRVPAAQAEAVRYAFGVLRRSGSPHLPAPRGLLAAERGARWMVTDWVPGQPLPVTRAARVADALAEARAIAHALAAIHGAGTHHGDVAPGNIVVTPTGGVVLVDLALLGRRGLGTPGFIAPEVLAGGGGPAADRFSLGCVLCMRLLGEAPWRRPESQLRVHDASAVAARLDALGADQLDSPIRELLIRLLHPEPTERVGDSGQLVTRLCRLHAAADAGLDLRRAEPWWCPARWPYRGPSLAAVLERLRGSERPRLVVVAGSSGVGRGRIVEELVQSLQTEADAPTATMAEPERLPAALGRGGSPWLEAWRRADEDLLVGALEPPTWPSGIDGREALVSRAAVLQQVASQAGATLLLPVAPELAAEASRRGAMVITVEPWTVDEVEGVLDGVVDASTRRAWAQRLHAATGGWPARVVRAAEACAAAQLDDPADPAVLDAVASDDGARLDPGTARAVMLAVWRGAAAIEGLPSHLHDSERPWATVEAVARRTLGSELLELARDVAELVEAEGQSPSLPLAIDAGRPAVIAAALESLRSEPPALAHWLDEGGAGSLPPAAVAAAMRLRLARGDVDAVLRLAPHAHCAQGYLVQARALQRRGELDAALRNAELAEASSSPDPRWSARGLRWRLWIDQGQGARALQDARAALPTAPEHGVGPATARLWAGMAALVGGEHEQALTWLDEAVDATAGVEGAEAAGVRARAHQLHGNLAQAQGQLREAQRRYAQAAVAFEEADEPVGGLMLRGSLAGLAVLAHDFSAGLEHGSAAIGGLLGRGQIAATLEAGLNLVQLLARVGADGQAQALGRLLDQLHGGSETALVVARLQRLRAELLLMRLRPGGRPRGGPVRGLQAAAESGFVAAATALAEVAAVESSEAWRLAAGLARVQGQQVRARSHLDRARAAASDDPDARAELALEAAQQQLVDADPTAVSHVLGRLAALPRPRSWLDRGRVDLALSYDRVLLAALRRRLPPEHPARRRVAQRWLGTLELVMKQTSPLDRDSVRGALLVDGGDSQPLRELLAELDDEAASAAASGPAPARVTTPRAAVPASTEHARAEQQLRIYRRLAREDRLELLLQQVVDSMMDLTDAERGAVVVRATPHTPRLEVTRELAEGSEGVRFSRSVIERVLAEGEPVLSVDAAADDRFDGSRSISHLNLRSVLAVPLRFRGECLGAAYVDHRLRRGNFDEHDLARMEEFAELAALAVAHARALAELRAQAQALETQQAELSRLLEAREAEVIGLREEVRAQGSPRGYRGIIGGTPVMQRIFKLVDRVADADVPVVIHGESGTGKELVARALHEAGPRCTGPFIAENCGAIPETLLESVLFGHAKGSFTGATSAKAGLFEAASGGTIFLDEVGEMSPGMQTKLLRVLQEGELRRVGDNRSRPIDVRVIAASNRDLPAMVERGDFRRDLYYRINVIKIELPALRERIDDLPALVEHFLTRHAGSGPPLRVSPAAMRVLAQHPWPGNVRELENEVQRWVALVEGEVRPEDLSMSPPRGSDGAPRLLLGDDPEDLQIRPRIEAMERALIARAMERTGNNQTKSAALLGLSRYGLQKKLRRLADAEAE